jgi:hypothetical protein
MTQTNAVPRIGADGKVLAYRTRVQLFIQVGKLQPDLS